MKELLEVLIKNLVVNQDEVSITEKSDAKSISYEVKVAKEDMGKVIGRQGKTAKAIRSLMKAIAIKEHKKVNVEFVD